MSNITTNFSLFRGKTKLIHKTFTASVAAEEGSIVYPVSGAWTIGDATAGDRFGVIRQTIATTDSDYASTKTVAIEVPAEPNVEWRFTVKSGTFTAADLDKYADLDATGKGIDVDTTSIKNLYINSYIDSTHGTCIFAGNVAGGLAMPATS